MFFVSVMSYVCFRFGTLASCAITEKELNETSLLNKKKNCLYSQKDAKLDHSLYLPPLSCILLFFSS